MDLLDDSFFWRNLVYGVEDSLLSTTGLVVGIAMAGMPRRAILVTGAILVLVEAMSMAFGAFVSESTFVEKSQIAAPHRLRVYATVMFVAYCVAGLIPMLPFAFDVAAPVAWSVALSMSSLFGMMLVAHHTPRRAAGITAVGCVILGISIGVGRFAREN